MGIFTMTDYKDKIEEILIEGFATSPARCWHVEADKDNIEEKRNENLKHIDYIADDILSLIQEVQKDTLVGFAKHYNRMLIDHKVKYKWMQLIISDRTIEEYLSKESEEKDERH